MLLIIIMKKLEKIYDICQIFIYFYLSYLLSYYKLGLINSLLRTQLTIKG